MSTTKVIKCYRCLFSNVSCLHSVPFCTKKTWGVLSRCQCACSFLSLFCNQRSPCDSLLANASVLIISCTAGKPTPKLIAIVYFLYDLKGLSLLQTGARGTISKMAHPSTGKLVLVVVWKLQAGGLSSSPDGLLCGVMGFLIASQPGSERERGFQNIGNGNWHFLKTWTWKPARHLC